MSDVLNKYSFKVLNVKKNLNYISTNSLNTIRPNELGVVEFNKVLFYVLDLKLRRLVRTDSGGISIDRKKFYGCGWDIKKTKTMFELLLVIDRKYYKFHFKQPTGKNEVVKQSGTRDWQRWLEIFAEFGVNMDDLAIDNGMEVKKTIERPYIALYRDSLKHKVIEQAHHIDFHSSHPSGICKYYPELRPAIEKVYADKENAPKGSYERDSLKQMLVSLWGYCQAEHIGAKWAHIARDGIKDTNERLMRLAAELIRNGREILAFNTDGIWYSGEIYHGEGEGPGLGQWSNDHTNCRIRFRSKGIYEFIEDGKYNPVVRGWTRYDWVVPREEWEWGDIYRSNVIKYCLDLNNLRKGVYVEDCNDDEVL